MRVAAACLSRALLAAACLFLVVAAPGAEEAPVSPTLEKIRAANAVYIGYREAAIPFSYLAGGGEAIGFSIDLCRHVTDAIQAQLNLQHLTVVPVPTTPGARQIMLETGTIDLDCGGTINTEQRQRDLAFSSTIFVAGIQALVSKDAGIRSFADLQGKTVTTVFGTTAAAYLTSAAARRGLQVSHRGSRDPAEGLQFLQRGEAAALVLDDVSLRGLLLQVAAAERFMLLDDRFGFESWAIVFRRHDPQFKKLVDRTLSGLMQSGEFARIYERWFTSPIPPDGGNLHLPMGDALRQLMLTPNDRGA